MKFYNMYAETCLEDFAKPGPEADVLVKGCRKSEFQFLDHKPLTVSLAESGGLIIPDFMIYEHCVPIVSERLRQHFKRAGVDNLFYKPIIFEDNRLGIRQQCWLALPPRIDCLDVDKSVIERESNEYADEADLLQEVKEIRINPRTIGNYKIFKLPAIYENQEIIVTEGLAITLQKEDYANTYFDEI